MNLTRRQRIEAMLADDPHDPFLRYSLANEMANGDDLEGSLAQLSGLMRDDPPYVPAFFRSAQHLVKLGRVTEARTALRDGIDHARNSGDAHAAGEMSEMLASLGTMGDDDSI